MTPRRTVPHAMDQPLTPPRRAALLRGLLLAAAAVCILLGIANGGMRDVLAKAVSVCTECIGLG